MSLPFVSRREFDRALEDLRREMSEKLLAVRRDVVRLDLCATGAGDDGWMPRFLTRRRDAA